MCRWQTSSRICHMSVVTAKVAGVPRIVTCAPPFRASLPAIVAAQPWAEPMKFTSSVVSAVGAMAIGTGPLLVSICWDSSFLWPKPNGSCSGALVSTCSLDQPRRLSLRT